jgi:hypothetical protein
MDGRAPRDAGCRMTTSRDDESETAPVGPITTHAAPLGKLARSIDLPRATMNALCGAGLGPPTFKLGRRVFCLLANFNRWLERVASGEVDATMASPKRRHLAYGETPTPERKRRREPDPKTTPRKLKVSADKGEAAKRPPGVPP